VTSYRNAIVPVLMAGARRAAAAPDCEGAFRRIATDALIRIRTQHAQACAGSAEAVHQIRIALTRLRAARSFFAAMVDDAVWPELKRDIRWLNRRLGAVRNGDVMRDYAGRGIFRDWAARAAIEPRLDVARDRRRLTRALRSARCNRLMDALAAWLTAGPWLTEAGATGRARRRAPLRAYAFRRLGRWRRRIARKKNEVERLGEKARHDLRIRAKRYRYMIEALAPLDPELHRRWHASARHARRAQDALGDLRDLQSFRRLAADCVRPPGYRRAKKRLLRRAGAALRRL
jgi:CHAD domain-containing protein